MTKLDGNLVNLSPGEKRELLAATLRRRLQTSGSRPLSPGQRALWFLHQVAPTSSAYNIAFTARIVSPVKVLALQRAFQGLVERHETLRSAFPAAYGEPVERIQSAMEVPFEVTDASGWSADRVHDRISEEIRRPFDLATGPVLRVRLFMRSPTESFLAATFHHIAMDGWSLWVCLSELRELYRAAVCDVVPNLPPVDTEFAAYARWQADLLSGTEGARHLEYWKRHLGTDLPILNLPTDHARPPVPTYRGASHRFRIGVEATERLKHLARDGRATLQMGVLTLFQILLHRYTGQDDLMVGYLSSGRSRTELESVVGYVANLLPLRLHLPADSTFRDVLKRTRDTLLEALDHQDCPFSLLVDQVSPDRDSSRSPLFQVLFVFEKPQLLEEENASWFIAGEPGARMRLGDLVLESLPFSAQQEGQFDLTLVVVEVEGQLCVSIDYNTDLFEPSTIRRMAGHLRTLADDAAAHSDRSVSKLALLTEGETAWLDHLNTTTARVPDVCFHQLFEEHASRFPEAVAVLFDGSELTYGELNARADRFARHLRKLGVGPDVAVGLCVERSPDLVTAMLGILKAGGAFVPLDAAYPRDRLAFMITDSQVPVLVTQRSLIDRLPPYGGQLVAIDEVPAFESPEADSRAPTGALRPTDGGVGVGPDNLAYIIYTSGSTGRPKGVLVEHRGLINVALEQQRLFGVGPHSRVLQFASLSFDAAVFEVAMALGSGAALYLAKPQCLLPGPPLLETLRAGAISVVTLPPSALVHLPPDDLPALTTVTVAGEACPPDLVSRWATGRRFFNLYGPTESTIWATVAHCTDGTRIPPIGRPIANTRTHVLDSQLQRVPIGIPGELHIGGIGLARGYHNRPDLTASKFIQDPFSTDPAARLYKTGDLVRLREGGDLEYLGRTDFQVKIRGFRIELGEIEAVLGQHPDVTQAAAIVRDYAPSDQRIVAYVVPRPSASLSGHALRSFLKERLPNFMVPAAFVVLDALPLSPSGKVDRRALTALGDSRPIEDTYVAPASELEERIALIWKNVLRVDHVGADDNFFDIGGSSLLIARVHARLSELAPSALSIVDMFQFPTIRALATQLTQGASGQADVLSAARSDALVAGQARLRDQASRRSGSSGNRTVG